MKSNFKISDKDKSVDESTNLIKESKDANFDDILNSLPKGWNLWSIRNSSKK